MARARQARLPTVQVGIAGEYLVAAELSRRGYVASLTLRNTRGIDILVSNWDASRSVGIQVKTSQGAKPEWVMSKKAEEDSAENLFYVFVCLPPDAPSSFHVVPRSEVSQQIREGHQRWLDTPGQHGQAHRDSNVRQFSDGENKYKDRWDLLGLGRCSVIEYFDYRRWPMPTPVEVIALENYQLWVKYSDGVEGVVDLSTLVGKGVFALWNDYQAFQEAHVGPSGEIAWSEEIDMCPDAIYLKITGTKPEDLFPQLRELTLQHA